MSYHIDRFYAAMAVLASDGHIKQRLTKAYEDHLDTIKEDELPPAVRPAFADVQAQMHRVAPQNGEGPIRASVRKMSPPEAGECAVAILSLYRELLKHGDSVQPELKLEVEKRKPVPPFLVKSG